MKKFVLVYHGKTMPGDISPEEMKSTMDKWMSWFGSFKDKMVDGGNPFGPDAKSVTEKGIEQVSKDKYPATGYTIINANNISEATEIAKSCPVIETGGAVRVYEAMPM